MKKVQAQIKCNWDYWVTNGIHFQNRITAFSCSSDGKFIICCGDQGLIRMINTETGVEKMLVGHEKWVNSLNFSSDNQMIVSGSSDKSVRIWNANSGQQIHVLSGHTSSVLCACFSPSGEYIASGSMHNSLRVWNLKKKQIKVLKCRGPVKSIDYSPNGRFLISSHGFESRVTIWNMATSKPTFKLSEENGVIYCVKFSPCGNFFAQSSHKSQISIRDFRRKKLITSMNKHENSVFSFDFSYDTKFLISGSRDCQVILWNLITRNSSIIKQYPDYVMPVQFSPDKKYIMSASNNTIDIQIANLDSV